MIIYDPGCIDSINVATTLAGLRDSIVVSPTVAETLQGQPYQLPVVADLRIYQWKNRVDVYRWAERNLLKEASPYLVAGLNPTIAERCLMRRILKAFPPGTTHLGWFAHEGQGVRLTSKAAIPVLASDYFFNLEVWTSMQNVEVGDLAGAGPSATVPPASAGGSFERPARGLKAYISFTISDGDNLQYDHNRMCRLWQDPARGMVPIGWTISPTLVQAAPALAAYYLRTATPNDELVAGPSGAGYIFPSRWDESVKLEKHFWCASITEPGCLPVVWIRRSD